jgi:N12 class adenine-specific DNA methylase
MEMRRLGLVNRPAFVVPNHMLEQFSREFLQLYPLAKVLVTTKGLTGPTGRQTFISRCATGDWDAVVITHSAFERLALRAGTYQAYSDEQLADLRANLDATRAAGARDQTVKQRELAVARAEEKLKALLATAAKDDGVCFEQSGVDFLLVDELHLFKNKALATSRA